MVTGKWKLFKSDILSRALPAAFIVNWAIHLVWTQVSSCNLDANPPVLRPTAEICLSLYTETSSTPLATVSFPTNHTSHLSLCFFQEFTNSISFPLQICCSTKPKPWLPQIALLIYRVILCHGYSSPTWQSTSAGISPCTAQLVTGSFSPLKKGSSTHWRSLPWFPYFLSRSSPKIFLWG